MKRTTRFISLLLVLILCLSVLPVGAAAMSTDGWTKGSDGNWYYWENGNRVTGWKKISGSWYWFYDSGVMKANDWLQEDGYWYHFGSNGKMETSKWVKETYSDGSADWYYQLSSGKGAKGWQKIGGVWYYFNPDWDDVMVTGGPIEIDGKLYYFKSSGALYTGWKKITDDDGEEWWMYFTSNGAAVGWKKISGAWYYFATESSITDRSSYPVGAMVYDDWLKDNDDWYYFNASGAMVASKWVKDGDYWFYQLSSGKSAMGWLKLGGVWYYFASDTGYMATGGPWEIGGKYYYFKDSGALFTGWKRFYTNPHDDRYYWMYFTSSGAYVNTTKKIDGKWYTFDEHGYWWE